MSVATHSPNSSWLPSFFTRQPSETAAEHETLLSSHMASHMDEECESENFMDAKKVIEDIALRLFVDVFTYRYVPKDPQATVLVRRDAEEARVFVNGETYSSHLKIVRLLHFMSGSTGVIDWKIATRLIDHALWALMTMVSITNKGRPFISSFQDSAAAYVMKELLFPLKRDMSNQDGESLLYKAVRRTDYVFGPEILAAIASRNDQRFRESELDDKAVIRTFEKRYKTKVGKGFVASDSSCR